MGRKGRKILITGIIVLITVVALGVSGFGCQGRTVVSTKETAEEQAKEIGAAADPRQLQKEIFELRKYLKEKGAKEIGAAADPRQLQKEIFELRKYLKEKEAKNSKQ